MKSPSLFDAKEIWCTNPLLAFETFLLMDEFQEMGLRRTVEIGPPKPLRKTSVTVYKSMFAKWLRWLETRNRTLLEVTSTDIMLFLDRSKPGSDEKVLNSRIRQKYLRLLDRVFIHLSVQPNPAQDAMFDIFKSGDRKRIGRDEPMAVLTEEQQYAFLQALPFATACTNSEDDSQIWKRRRDGAMMAMMLGAGLKVSEVIGIWTENVGTKDASGSIPVTISPASADGTVRWHQTKLRPFAIAEVSAWMQEREELRIPGPLLFPASLEGGLLNKSTVYRQVNAMFELAGIDVSRRGGRTLRNSFAVRELNAGRSIKEVGELLGHHKERSTEYYLGK